MAHKRDADPPDEASWASINDITTQLVVIMDSLTRPCEDHVMARGALARTIALMRSDRSMASEDVLNKQLAQQLFRFRVLDAGLLA